VTDAPTPAPGFRFHGRSNSIEKPKHLKERLEHLEEKNPDVFDKIMENWKEMLEKVLGERPTGVGLRGSPNGRERRRNASD
jgi:hypothetical protein